LYNTVQSNSSKLNEKVVSLEQGQNTILAGIADSKNQTLKVSSEVAALGSTQARLHQESQKSIQHVADNLSAVANSQESFKADLVVSNKTSSKIAEDVAFLGQKQSQLNSDLQSNNNRLNEKVALLEQGQNSIVAGIADSKNQTLKLSSEVAALGDKQAKFQETSGNSISDIVNNLSLITGNQEILKAALVVSHNENAGIANTLSEINQNQDMLKAGLVVSHNEAAGVSNKVASMNETQKELKQIMQDSNTRLSQKVASLEKSQSDLQNGIENVRNETKKIAADISVFSNGQTNLQEAVESCNKQLTDRVTVVEKSQQDWQETIKQLQQSMQQVAGNISTFEQNISKLQEIFQGRISDLTNTSNAGAKGQLEFQEKMKSDLASLSEAVSVLKQGQTSMQQKIEEVQTSTKSMSVEFPAALEQMKKDMDLKKETEYSTDK
jgi:chromosome segregation ATPase